MRARVCVVFCVCLSVCPYVHRSVHMSMHASACVCVCVCEACPLPPEHFVGQLRRVWRGLLERRDDPTEILKSQRLSNIYYMKSLYRGLLKIYVCQCARWISSPLVNMIPLEESKAPSPANSASVATVWLPPPRRRSSWSILFSKKRQPSSTSAQSETTKKYTCLKWIVTTRKLSAEIQYGEVGNINQILEILMHPVSQTQPELFSKTQHPGVTERKENFWPNCKGTQSPSLGIWNYLLTHLRAPASCPHDAGFGRAEDDHFPIRWERSCLRRAFAAS